MMVKMVQMVDLEKGGHQEHLEIKAHQEEMGVQEILGEMDTMVEMDNQVELDRQADKEIVALLVNLAKGVRMVILAEMAIEVNQVSLEDRGMMADPVNKVKMVNQEKGAHQGYQVKMDKKEIKEALVLLEDLG